MARPLGQERRTQHSRSTLARVTVPPTVVSSNDGASLFVPPSPTLSTQSSVHFATLLSLRDNKPDERNGYSSLHLLSSPMDKLSAHHRKSSNATFASSHEGHSSLDKTELDHTSGDYGMAHLHPVRSDPTSTMPSPTHTHVDTTSVLSRSQHTKSDISLNVRWTIEGLLATLQACLRLPDCYQCFTTNYSPVLLTIQTIVLPPFHVPPSSSTSSLERNCMEHTLMITAFITWTFIPT
ncbi:hypothetical protein BDR05DRAFT_1006068 [Suillus weaverae]|nr:hypothetical protein BDR05DRAFT_1006068 [Suillus weaverae]